VGCDGPFFLWHIYVTDLEQPNSVWKHGEGRISSGSAMPLSQVDWAPAFSIFLQWGEMCYLECQVRPLSQLMGSQHPKSFFWDFLCMFTRIDELATKSCMAIELDERKIFTGFDCVHAPAIHFLWHSARMPTCDLFTVPNLLVLIFVLCSMLSWNCI